jgi:hypothetical protein
VKFFTAEWWFVVTPDLDRWEETERAFKEYASYLDSIDSHLKAVPEILRSPNAFHDDGLDSIEIRIDEVQLDLIEANDGHPRTLIVRGVRSISQECWDIEDGIDPRHLYVNGDDIGYNELYVDEEKQTLTLSLIFRSGNEIMISGYLDSIQFEFIDPS